MEASADVRMSACAQFALARRRRLDPEIFAAPRSLTRLSRDLQQLFRSAARHGARGPGFLFESVLPTRCRRWRTAQIDLAPVGDTQRRRRQTVRAPRQSPTFFSLFLFFFFSLGSAAAQGSEAMLSATGNGKGEDEKKSKQKKKRKKKDNLLSVSAMFASREATCPSTCRGGRCS